MAAIGIGTTVSQGSIYYSHATNAMHFGTADGERMVIDCAGAVTVNSQPSFNAEVGYGSQNNVTGDATAHVVVFNTERFDRGTDYDTSTGVFTAPVTGLYQLNATVQVAGVTTAMNDSIMRWGISNSGATFWSGSGSENFQGGFSQSGAVLADMDAGDTACVVVDFRSGAKVVCVWTASEFSGFLAA